VKRCLTTAFSIHHYYSTCSQLCEAEEDAGLCTIPPPHAYPPFPKVQRDRSWSHPIRGDARRLNSTSALLLALRNKPFKMCFNTEIEDPTQQPIRVVQSHEAQDIEAMGDVIKTHKTWPKTTSRRAAEENGNTGQDKHNSEAAYDDGGRRKSTASAGGSPDSRKKSKSYTQAELERMHAYRQLNNPFGIH